MAKKKAPKKPAKRRPAKNAAKAKKFKAAASKRRAKLVPKKKSAKKAAPAAKLSPKLQRRLDDQNKKAEGLMERGRMRGFVTYDEILKAFPTIESDVMFLEELYDKFQTARIDVLEGGGMLEITEEEPIKGYSRSDSQYDSIQMYLREIGEYPLLNGEQERSLADQSRTIRIPVHMVETIAKYKQVSRRLAQALGRDPLAEEVALEMGVDVEKIYQIEKIDQDTVSLESPVGSDDGEDKSVLGDFIKDDKILSPDQEVSRRILGDQLKEILDELSPKEREILKLRHGLEDGIYHTLEEVGKKFGVTRERIRQIEAKALERIRTHEKARRLKSY